MLPTSLLNITVLNSDTYREELMTSLGPASFAALASLNEFDNSRMSVLFAGHNPTDKDKDIMFEVQRGKYHQITIQVDPKTLSSELTNNTVTWKFEVSNSPQMPVLFSIIVVEEGGNSTVQQPVLETTTKVEKLEVTSHVGEYHWTNTSKGLLVLRWDHPAAAPQKNSFWNFKCTSANKGNTEDIVVKFVLNP